MWTRLVMAKLSILLEEISLLTQGNGYVIVFWMPVEVQYLSFESCVLNKPTEHCSKVNLPWSAVDELVNTVQVKSKEAFILWSKYDVRWVSILKWENHQQFWAHRNYKADNKELNSEVFWFCHPYVFVICCTFCF